MALLNLLGLSALVIGIAGMIKPLTRLRMQTRKHAAVVLAAGFLAMMVSVGVTANREPETPADAETSAPAGQPDFAADADEDASLPPAQAEPEPPELAGDGEVPSNSPSPQQEQPGSDSPRGPPAPAGELIVHYIDVGQGDATLLQGPDFTILIDAGRHTQNDVVPYLRSAGVQKLNLVIGTHPHADHIGQMDKVMQAFPVDEVWMSGDKHASQTFERTLDAILASDAGYHEPRAGEVYDFGSARVEVINPDRLTGDLHEGSVSVRIVYGDIAFVFTGDAERQTEAAMLRRGHKLKAQILQLGHHGSSTSSTAEFLRAVSPEVAIYSAGVGNSYGHPHREVVDRLASLGIPTYGTDVYGTIQVITDGATYEVLTAKSGQVSSGAGATPAPAPGPVPEPSPLPSAGCQPGQVNINTAGAEELKRITDVGDVIAQNILAAQQSRPFQTVDDLTRVSGIAAGRLSNIKAQGLACVGN